MSVSANDLWDIIIAAWNWPVALRTLPYQSLDYVHDPSITPTDVLFQLLKSCPVADVETAISQHLESVASLFETNEHPTLRDLFLAHSCIMLVTLRGGPCRGPMDPGDSGGSLTKLSIPTEIVRHIVGSFPPVGWYMPVGWLIEDYLSECEVFESLCTGLTKPHPPEMLLWLLGGFRLYKGLARKLDSSSHRMSVVSEVIRVLEKLEHNDNKFLCAAATSARIELAQYVGKI